MTKPGPGNQIRRYSLRMADEVKAVLATQEIMTTRELARHFDWHILRAYRYLTHLRKAGHIEMIGLEDSNHAEGGQRWTLKEHRTGVMPAS